MPRIVAGSNTVELSQKVSGLTKARIVRKSVKKFPDGETYVRLGDSDFKGENVFIIHSLYPMQNENLIELFLTINAVKEGGGKPVAVIPYFAYGRQDKIFLKGEAFSLKAVATILKALGTERLITVDAHFHRKPGDYRLFGLRGTNLSAAKLLAEHVRKERGALVIAGPDEGSKDFLTGLEGAVFLKKGKRMLEGANVERKYEVEIALPKNLKGKNVLVLDDMTSSGKTMMAAAKALKERGNRVYVACTHGLFTDEAVDGLKKYTDYVICTDTVKTVCSKVSVAGIIAEELKK
ncbi:MAG: ribose-phosphate pyrophosphokinase [Candidatus Aenigmatarchaeota archaeon]|nr:MAG: ribose-phosphate pyrophosphokinase [Candidatus Aenigmarchaeota archaeon]